MYSYTMSE